MDAVEKEIIGLFDAANWIKTDDNKDIYDACADHNYVWRLIVELNHYKRNNNKKDFFDDIDMFSYTNDMFSSFNRFLVIYESLCKCNVEIPFSPDDLCKFIIQISINNLNYTFPRNHRGNYIPSKLENVDSPFFTVNDISNIDTDISVDLTQKILDVFSVAFSDLTIEKMDEIIEYNGKYICIYPIYFVSKMYKILEKYYIDIVKNKDEYYKMRGRGFENLVCNMLGDFLSSEKIYSNYCYLTPKEKNELDFVLDSEKDIIIFEAKSSKYNEPKNFMDEESDIVFDLKKSFGRGFKTLDKAKDYFSNNVEVMLKKGDKSVKINTKGKNIHIILVSFNDMKSISGRITKIIDNSRIINIPICLNYCDLNAILVNARTLNRFVEYLSKKEYLCKYKKLSFEFDEIDAYGIMMSNKFDTLTERIEIMKNIDLVFMLNDATYRNKAVEEISSKFLWMLIEGYTDIIDRLNLN